MPHSKFFKSDFDAEKANLVYSSSRLRRRPQNEDNFKNKDNLKNEDDHKNEDNLKNEDHLKNEADLKIEAYLKNWPIPQKHSPPLPSP